MRTMIVALAAGIACASFAAPAGAGERTQAQRVQVPAYASSEAAPKASVAYQVGPTHSGAVAGNLKLPLKQAWAANLGGSIGYPVVAGGAVVVAANGALEALNAATGATLWSQPAPTGAGWVGPAYDGGTIFSNVLYTSGSSGVGMFAFDATTGAQVWSAEIPGQYAFSSPPTATNGTVYTGGAGSGGTLYAYAESSGHLNWRASVENGDSSSPVVAQGSVFVSYACPQTYSFDAQSGAQNWHFSGPCEGGGGSTGVLYKGLLFVEDSDVVNGYDGIVLRASDGAQGANFNSEYPPAFSGGLGYFVPSSTTFSALRIPKMTQAWTASIPPSDAYATPPLIVGKTVYVETRNGVLLGYAARTGKVQVHMTLGFSDGSPGSSQGLGFGGGTLFVPAGSELIALTGS